MHREPVRPAHSGCSLPPALTKCMQHSVSRGRKPNTKSTNFQVLKRSIPRMATFRPSDSILTLAPQGAFSKDKIKTGVALETRPSTAPTIWPNSSRNLLAFTWCGRWVQPWPRGTDVSCYIFFLHNYYKFNYLCSVHWLFLPSRRNLGSAVLGSNNEQKGPLAVLGERQSRFKFYGADNWVRLLSASENLHDCTKTHTRAKTGKHTHARITQRIADFFGAMRCIVSSWIKQLRDRGIKCVSITAQIFHLAPVVMTLYGNIMGKYQIRLFHLEGCCAMRTALEINWAAR